MNRMPFAPVFRRLPALAAALAAACSSPPEIRTYTLLAPAPTAAETALPGAPAAFELLPVGVPPQVDVPQVVARRDGTGLTVLENDRWSAPLPEEVRSALAAALTRRLGGAPEVTGLARPPGAAVPRIKVDLRRFDAEPSRALQLEAVWSVRPRGGVDERALLCRADLSEPVGPDVAALVAGHQRALARLAERIALSVAAPAGRPAGLCIDAAAPPTGGA